MHLDIRLPIGGFFALIGTVMTGYGLFSDKAIYQRSLGHDVNLWWGLVLLVFGVVMLWMGRKGTSGFKTAEEEGDSTGER
jgi:hypothetical protein